MSRLRIVLLIVGLLVLLIAAPFVGASLWQQADPTKAAPASGRFVRANDVDLFIQEWGPASGPPILMVHAAGGWSGVWERAAEPLARAGFRVIAIDMPPLGYSQRPAKPAYGRDDQAGRIVGALDTLGVRRAILLGHSFGARAVAEATIRFPDRVAGLILVSAALSLDSPQQPPNFLDRLLRWSGVRQLITASTLSNPLFTGTLLKMFVADSKSATPYWVGLYRRPLNVRGTYAATADWLPELLAEPPGSLSSRSASFAAVSVPALVVWGDKDTVTPLADGELIAKSIPGARLVVLPGIGHLPPIEAEMAFNDIVLEFMRAQGVAR